MDRTTGKRRTVTKIIDNVAKRRAAARSARTRTDISLVAALLLAPDGCQAPAICHERQQRVRNATVIAILSAQDVKLALGKAESDLVE